MTDPKNEKKSLSTILRGHLPVDIPESPGRVASELRKMMKWGKPHEHVIILSDHVRIMLILASLWLDEFEYQKQTEAAKPQEESETKN